MTCPGPIVQGPPRKSIALEPDLGHPSIKPIAMLIAVPTLLYYRIPYCVSQLSAYKSSRIEFKVNSH